MDPNQSLNQEIVGTLPSPEALESAVSEITSSGWDRSEISILGQHSLIGDERIASDSRDVAEDPDAEHQAMVSDTDIRQGRTLAAGTAGVIAAFVASGATILTGGTALVAVVGAAVAGGGAAAVVEGAARLIGQKRDDFLQEQIEQGGILLWVKLRRPEEADEARAILARHGATNIDVHPSAGQDGQASGTPQIH